MLHVLRGTSGTLTPEGHGPPQTAGPELPPSTQTRPWSPLRGVA